jgi:hypothetical protein
LSFFTSSRRQPTQDKTIAEDDPTPESGTDSDRGPKHPAWSWVRMVLGWLLTALAGALVLFALVAPNDLNRLTWQEFARIPVEAIIGAALILALPSKARRIAAVLIGAALGVLTILKIFDMGFFSVLVRPFNPVFDWISLKAAVDFVDASAGRAAAVGAVIGTVLLALGLIVGLTLAVLRLSRLVVDHQERATRAVRVLAILWVASMLFGSQLVPGVPVADSSASTMAYNHVVQFRTALHDKEIFARESAVDAFRDTPGDQLLTGLRGKDVVLTFVESYGRTAVQGPEFAPRIQPLLDEGTRKLHAAGFGARSGFLTSSTAGGGSWLAHGTTLSGLWVDNQQRYNTLVSSDRLTLNGAFQRADWRTVAVMPNVTQAWPEGEFFGYDHVYHSSNIGYQGPKFSWSAMPDQFTMSAFERLERARKDRGPVMAEIALVSSHAPWDPIPKAVDWNAVGDGSVFNSMSAPGDATDVILSRDPARVRDDYRNSLEYTLNNLISYVEHYGDDNLVLVFLGDHEPAPVATGDPASRDVPITIVARDPAVLERISGWGWTEGLRPDPHAPVWRMDAFRDKFLTAFGPQAPAQAPVPAAR